jgi:hypothetical protein
MKGAFSWMKLEPRGSSPYSAMVCRTCVGAAGVRGQQRPTMPYQNRRSTAGKPSSIVCFIRVGWEGECLGRV